MTERPPTDAAPAATPARVEEHTAALIPGIPRELCCKRRICRTVLARVIGATLVLNDNSRVGPMSTGMVFARKCHRCGTDNVFWV